jgi:hypothetical protein
VGRLPRGRIPCGRLPRVVSLGQCDAYIDDGVRGIETVDVVVVRDSDSDSDRCSGSGCEQQQSAHLAVNLVVPVAGVPVVVPVVVTVVVSSKAVPLYIFRTTY